MELLDVELRALADSAPQNRAAFLMHFEHMLLCFFARITKHALKNHCHICHQIHWIIMNDDLPGHIELFFTARFPFPDRRFHCRCRFLFELHGADRAHEKMLSQCCRTLKRRLRQDFPLNRFHFSRACLVTIVEAVQMKQTMHDVQAELARE